MTNFKPASCQRILVKESAWWVEGANRLYDGSRYRHLLPFRACHIEFFVQADESSKTLIPGVSVRGDASAAKNIIMVGFENIRRLLLICKQQLIAGR
mmetsp:Transcript_79316/g.119248  ORF Transcript_79316/g.119248 Transcript_79316/m.119248 type:complete len:97 (-) Transcript_79316:85-375(-)